jgi:hypothetical protein
MGPVAIDDEVDLAVFGGADLACGMDGPSPALVGQIGLGIDEVARRTGTLDESLVIVRVEECGDRDSFLSGRRLEHRRSFAGSLTS